MFPISIKDITGTTYKFNSKPALKKALRDEINFWSSIQKKHSELIEQRNLYDSSGNSLRRSMEGAKHLNTFLEKISGKKKYETSPLTDDLKDKISSTWMNSKSQLYSQWSVLLEISAKAADDFLEISNSGRIDEISDFLAKSMYAEKLKVKSFLDIDESAYENAKITINKEISLLKDQRSRLIMRCLKTRKDLDAWQEEQSSNWERRTANLEELYAEKLRLDKPAEYWRRKADNHWTRGTVFFSILACTLIIFATCIGVLFSMWLSGIHTKISLNTIEGVVMFITMVSSIAFFSRLLAKVAFSEFHLQRDAEEREQLTYFYLSLKEKTNIDEDSSKIILQSLFSRSETGLLSNENGPTMPGLIDLVSAARKGGS